MRWSSGGLALSLALPAMVLAIVHCSDFETSPSPSSSSSLDASTTTEAAATDAVAPLPDAVADAAPPAYRIECNGTTCDSRTEVCCMYASKVTLQFSGECVVGASANDCNPAGADEELLVASECDDRSDCASPLICCHSYLAPTSCGGKPSAATCTTEINCSLCGDGGIGTSVLPCDPTIDNQCPPGKICVAASAKAVIASGYCQ